MTHDELVFALNKGITMVGQRMATHEEDANLYRRTVIAVVKLHKPRGAEPMWCGECVIFDGQPHPYPCPTIEAVEKELA
jgi:hypothetical protein